MALILFIIFVIFEIGFAVSGIFRKPTKTEWKIKRLIVNAAECMIYIILLLLPGIDFSFRFKALALLLVIRLFIAALATIFAGKKENPKKVAAIVFSAVISIVLIAISMVPAFMFSDYKGLPTTGEYKVAEAKAILIDENRVEEFEADGSKREVPAHFYFPENISEIAADSLPLVIFSHGAFGYYQSNSSTYMELASNGYVVVSLDHPYHSFFATDTNGKTVTVDPTFFQTAMDIGSKDVPESEIYDITSQWMKLRVDDMNFVIDTLEAAGKADALTESFFLDENNENEILSVIKATDFDKIGLMGHSLGGATAVTVGRRDDVSAVIDLDGTMLGEETGVKDGEIQINEAPYETPLLSVENEEHHRQAMEADVNSYAYANNVILNNASCGYETYFKNSGHMNFTDLPLFAPALANMLGTGSIDAKECVETMNEIVLNFYDCYLKNTGEFSVEESY